MSVLACTKYNKLESITELASELVKIINEETVFVCIGTDRSTADSFAPFIGSKLKESDLFNYPVYGTIENPVHALNLKDYINFIKKEHPHSNIIAIDAAISTVNEIGTIKIREGKLYPGAGANKKLPPIGNYSVVGIMSNDNFSFSTVRLHHTIKMANVIVESIVLAVNMQKELRGDLYEVKE